MHPQSLAQSGIYLQIWANGEPEDSTVGKGEEIYLSYNAIAETEAQVPEVPKKKKKKSLGYQAMKKQQKREQETATPSQLGSIYNIGGGGVRVAPVVPPAAMPADPITDDKKKLLQAIPGHTKGAVKTILEKAIKMISSAGDPHATIGGSYSQDDIEAAAAIWLSLRPGGLKVITTLKLPAENPQGTPSRKNRSELTRYNSVFIAVTKPDPDRSGAQTLVHVPWNRN
jgi:hypothetical protein